MVKVEEGRNFGHFFLSNETEYLMIKIHFLQPFPIECQIKCQKPIHWLTFCRWSHFILFLLFCFTEFWEFHIWHAISFHIIHVLHLFFQSISTFNVILLLRRRRPALIFPLEKKGVDQSNYKSNMNALVQFIGRNEGMRNGLDFHGMNKPKVFWIFQSFVSSETRNTFPARIQLWRSLWWSRFKNIYGRQWRWIIIKM